VKRGGQATASAGATEGRMKIVLLGDDDRPMAEIEDLEQYDLSTTRGRAMLVDDILVALGQADRRRVLNFMHEHPPNEGEPSVVTELPERS
jgi:hypothetical protein